MDSTRVQGRAQRSCGTHPGVSPGEGVSYPLLSCWIRNGCLCRVDVFPVASGSQSHSPLASRPAYAGHTRFSRLIQIRRWTSRAYPVPIWHCPVPPSSRPRVGQSDEGSRASPTCPSQRIAASRTGLSWSPRTPVRGGWRFTGQWPRSLMEPLTAGTGGIQ